MDVFGDNSSNVGSKGPKGPGACSSFRLNSVSSFGLTPVDGPRGDRVEVLRLGESNFLVGEFFTGEFNCDIFLIGELTLVGALESPSEVLFLLDPVNSSHKDLADSIKPT